MLYHSHRLTKNSLPVALLCSGNMSLLKMTTVFCASLFLVGCSLTMAAPTNEVMEADEAAALAHGISGGAGGDRLQNELAMVFPNENISVEQFNKLFGDRLRTLFLSFPNDKMIKRDDDIPPGFIGVRGRRGSRSPRDFQEILRSLLNNGSPGGQLMVTPEMHNFIKGQMKKSDSNNVYKDGFLGVRG